MLAPPARPALDSPRYTVRVRARARANDGPGILQGRNDSEYKF